MRKWVQLLNANNVEGRIPESVQDAQLDVQPGGRRNADERGESDEEQEQVSPRQVDGRFRVVREPDRAQDLQRRLCLFLTLLVNIHNCWKTLQATTLMEWEKVHFAIAEYYDRLVTAMVGESRGQGKSQLVFLPYSWRIFNRITVNTNIFTAIWGT